MNTGETKEVHREDINNVILESLVSMGDLLGKESDFEEAALPFPGDYQIIMWWDAGMASFAITKETLPMSFGYFASEYDDSESAWGSVKQYYLYLTDKSGMKRSLPAKPKTKPFLAVINHQGLRCDCEMCKEAAFEHWWVWVGELESAVAYLLLKTASLKVATRTNSETKSHDHNRPASFIKGKAPAPGQVSERSENSWEEAWSPPRGNANLAYLQLFAEHCGSGLLPVLPMRDANARSSWLERISTTTMREVCVSDLYQLLPILKRLHPSPSPFDQSWVVGEGLPLDEDAPVQWQWELCVCDPENEPYTEFCGYIAIFHTRTHRWGIRIVLDLLPPGEPNDPIYVCDTLQQAKDMVDQWLASPSPEFPELTLL
jgi:hypothetical protein